MYPAFLVPATQGTRLATGVTEACALQLGDLF